LCTAIVPLIEEGAVQADVRVIDWPGANPSRTMNWGSTPEIDRQMVLPPEVTENPSILGPIATASV
jgi:hypothetical protein